MNENKVVNKIITVETMIKLADFLEEYNDKYTELLKKDKEKNEALPYNERVYEYNGEPKKVKYTFYFKDGKTLTEEGYTWFTEQLNYRREINGIDFNLSLSCFPTNESSKYIHINIYMKENRVTINVDSTNLEQEANSVFLEIKKILDNTEERYNKTIKNRGIRKQCFCITIGIVLSYIVYLIFIFNKTKIPESILGYINKNVLIFGQWIVAIVLGNIFGGVIISNIYKPLVPEKTYAGYNQSSGKSIYRDDLQEYMSKSEVQIGEYYNADKRRKLIEKIYRITSKIIIAQLLLSLVFYFIIK